MRVRPVQSPLRIPIYFLHPPVRAALHHPSIAHSPSEHENSTANFSACSAAAQFLVIFLGIRFPRLRTGFDVSKNLSTMC